MALLQKLFDLLPRLEKVHAGRAGRAAEHLAYLVGSIAFVRPEAERGPLLGLQLFQEFGREAPGGFGTTRVGRNRRRRFPSHSVHEVRGPPPSFEVVETAPVKDGVNPILEAPPRVIALEVPVDLDETL